MKLSRGLLLLVALVSGSAARADMFTPTHSCSKPFRPYQFTSEFERDQYREQVKSYERCMDEFISEQKSQARKHLDAAKEAVDEWNNFVRTQLR